jgi:hypothetical protein
MIRAKLPPQIEWQEIRRAKRRPASAFCGMTYLLGIYRHGEKRKVGLPLLKSESAASKRPLRGEKRKHVVSDIIDLLKGWRSTPLEYEAAARTGLRSGLVLDGNRWAVADFEAAEIVAEGLRIIGAKRPTWEEAQARYVDRGDYCARCAEPMPDEMISGRRNQRFCSPECARAALEDRHSKQQSMNSRVTRAAQALVRREKLPPLVCEWCGDPFRPMNPGHYGTQRFCSQDCSAAARAVHQDVACPACGTMFRAIKKHGGVQKFCSRACADSYGRMTSYPRICEACGAPFVTKAKNGRFCSPACKTFESKHTRGVYAHNSLSLRLFDFMFTAPIALAKARGVPKAGETPVEVERPERMFLTVGIFDRLCEAA